jgi:predicted small lipoprotein YifL
VRKFLMNWKLLLVAATLSLTTSLTACGKKEDAAAPDAIKAPETSTPVDAIKGAGDAMKDGAAKTGDAMKDGAAKTGDAMKDGAAKTGDAVKGAGDAAKDAAGNAVVKTGEAIKGEKPATDAKPADKKP